MVYQRPMKPGENPCVEILGLLWRVRKVREPILHLCYNNVGYQRESFICLICGVILPSRELIHQHIPLKVKLIRAPKSSPSTNKSHPKRFAVDNFFLKSSSSLSLISSGVKWSVSIGILASFLGCDFLSLFQHTQESHSGKRTFLTLYQQVFSIRYGRCLFPDAGSTRSGLNGHTLLLSEYDSVLSRLGRAECSYGIRGGDDV